MKKKISLLLQKLGTVENTKYMNLILPKNQEEISFEEIMKILSGIFDKRDSLFHTRYKHLNTIKQENEYFVIYTGKVSSQCELFELGELSIDMFKWLIFVQWLTAVKIKAYDLEF